MSFRFVCVSRMIKALRKYFDLCLL